MVRVTKAPAHHRFRIQSDMIAVRRPYADARLNAIRIDRRAIRTVGGERRVAYVRGTAVKTHVAPELDKLGLSVFFTWLAIQDHRQKSDD